MPLSFKHFWDGIRLVPSSTNTTSEKGDLQVLDGDSQLYFHNGTSASALLTASSSNTGSNRLQNKELDDSSVFFVDNGDLTKKLAFQLSGITTGTTRTLTIPNASTTIVGTDVAQSLTNKTISGSTNIVSLLDSNFTLQDNGDVTKQAVFELSGITTGNTRTFTLPDASTELVGTDNAQTITNKLFNGVTSGYIQFGTIDTDFQIHDTFGDRSSFLRFDCNFGANNTSIKYAHTTSFTTGIQNNLTIADTSSSQTLTNKTISTANNTIQSGAATVGQVLTADGASGTSWTSISSNLSDNALINNVGLLTAVNEAAALNLRATLKDKDGNTPSPSSMVTISFANSVSTTEANYEVVTHDSSLTLNLPGGAGHTLGLSAGGAIVYVYAILDLDDIPSGIRLGFGARNREFGDSGYSVYDIGAGAANNANRIYSDFATSNGSFRVIGEINVIITTPGDWDTINYITLYPTFNAPYQSITNDMISDVNGIKLTNSSVTGSKIQTSIDLPGNLVLENGKPVVVSSATPSSSTSIMISRAGFDSGGTSSYGEGFTLNAHGVGSGSYQLNISPAFSATPVIVATVNSSGSYVCTIHSITTSSCTVKIVDMSNTPTDQGFQIIAMGPR